MHFIDEALDNYVIAHTQDEPDYLRELTRETYQKVLQPRMLSGAYQGRVLSMISKLVRPKTVLDIGTFTGYSALCLAEGLAPKGTVHTVDMKEELVYLQQKYFQKSPFAKAIIPHLGSALDIIPQLDFNFDLVFIDADKQNYINYFHQVIDKMNIGGLILSDNVLWSGKVIEALDDQDMDTRILLAYNILLKQDKRLETVLLPIRDGLTLSRVIA